jgi:hypothetical protein
MVTLSANWLTEGHIDFEYKKYLLLAYLQQVESRFQEIVLYPHLQELVEHYHNLLGYKKQTETLKQDFPKTVTAIDFQDFSLKFKSVIEDDAIMQELADIVDFSLPIMEQKLKEGKEIYHWIESQMTIYPLGLHSVRIDSGLVILATNHTSQASVYKYQITVFESSNDKYRGVNFSLIEQFQKSPFTTFESVKLEILNKYKFIVAPATYLLLCNAQIPFEESLLPVAKRRFMQYIAQQ